MAGEQRAVALPDRIALVGLERVLDPFSGVAGGAEQRDPTPASVAEIEPALARFDAAAFIRTSWADMPRWASENRVMGLAEGMALSLPSVRA